MPFLAAARLILNLLDGMVARRTGTSRPMGEVWNEVGDRLGDVLFIGALAFVPAVGPALALGAALAAVLASFVGLAARAAGGRRLYGGVLSKPGRMIVLAVAAPLALLVGDRGSSPLGAVILLVGGVVTLLQRLRTAAQELGRAGRSGRRPADRPRRRVRRSRHPRPARGDPGQRCPGGRPAPGWGGSEHAPEALGHLGRPGAALAAGGLLRPLPVAIVVTIFAVVGLLEFARLTDLPDAHRRLLLGAAFMSGVLSLFGSTALLAAIPILLLAGMLQPVLFPDIRSAVRHLAFGALAFGYLPLLLGHAVLIVEDLAGGAGILFVTGVAVAFSDIGAYVAGRTFDRYSLAPTISPNKTVEGLAGNLVGAVIGYAIFLPVLPILSPVLLAALPIVVALGAVWGDLFELALKREFGTKDTCTWLPGFGGLLYRIDSLILVVPLIYYLFRAAGVLKP